MVKAQICKCVGGHLFGGQKRVYAGVKKFEYIVFLRFRRAGKGYQASHMCR